MILAGDMGGTKTNLALFESGRERPTVVDMKRFETAAYSDPGAMIEDFLGQHPGETVTSACLAVAGPVVDGRSHLTNVSWALSQEDLARRFGWRRCLLRNDLEATIQAIPLLKNSETASLHDARPAPHGTLGVLAPGTGLGAALGLKRNGGVIALASEAGHGDFTPLDEDGLSLWRYLAAREKPVCLEHILSGPGLHRLYEWRRAMGDAHPDPATAKAIEESQDPSARISALALQGEDPVCAKALTYFVRYLGGRRRQPGPDGHDPGRHLPGRRHRTQNFAQTPGQSFRRRLLRQGCFWRPAEDDSRRGDSDRQSAAAGRGLDGPCGRDRLSPPRRSGRKRRRGLSFPSGRSAGLQIPERRPAG